MKALAEAAAARENAQFERLIAEKEHAHKEREAEIERKRQQEHKEHEKELSILAANRKVAVADAKLKAIERVIDEEENESKDEISEMPKLKSEIRTEDWVQTNFTVQNRPQETEVTRQSHQNLPRQIYADNPCEPEKSNHINFSPNGLPASSTPILEASVSRWTIETELAQMPPRHLQWGPYTVPPVERGFQSYDKQRRSLSHARN